MNFFWMRLILIQSLVIGACSEQPELSRSLKTDDDPSSSDQTVAVQKNGSSRDEKKSKKKDLVNSDDKVLESDPLSETEESIDKPILSAEIEAAEDSPELIPCAAEKNLSLATQFEFREPNVFGEPIVSYAKIASKFLSNQSPTVIVHQVDSTYSDIIGRNTNITTAQSLDILFAFEHRHELVTGTELVSLRESTTSWKKTPCSISPAKNFTFKRLRPSFSDAGSTYEFNKPYPVLTYPKGDLSKIVAELSEQIVFDLEITKRISNSTTPENSKEVPVPAACKTLTIVFKLEKLDEDDGIYLLSKNTTMPSCLGYPEFYYGDFSYKFSTKTNKILSVVRKMKTRDMTEMEFK